MNCVRILSAIQWETHKRIHRQTQAQKNERCIRLIDSEQVVNEMNGAKGREKKSKKSNESAISK